MTVLFDRFFDDAAIFPPGNEAMDVAVRTHVAVTGSPLGRHIGPFVCSADRLVGLGDALSATDVDHIDLALVTPLSSASSAITAAHDDPRLRLRAVEVSGTEPGDPFPVVPEGTMLVVERAAEPPFDLPDDAALKLRTGGETPAAFPDETQLTSALTAAVAQGLSFKLTAGLHHAVRHTDPATGFEHHGFLNVILATHAALSGEGDVAEALGTRDPALVAAAITDLDESARGDVRSRFLSFGTCSINEPLDDLRGFGLLPSSVLEPVEGTDA
jgi:hypothetical protein